MAARWVLHDIRSPAQSLTLLADLLGDPHTEFEKILRESCAHLGRSLDLLSRVLHPVQAAELGPISVREPLQFIVDLHRAGRTLPRLELDIDPAVRAAAGIERHLEHALLNLVLNATEALHRREDGLVRIIARDAADTVRITVADNGPGVAPHVADGLFESPVTTKAGPHPAGFGLLVAREVLRLSGGTLTRADGDGPGASFVMMLPHWRREAAPPRR